MPTIRTVRADLASHVRRAAAGERITVTVGGIPSAVLGPLTVGEAGGSMDALVSSGRVVAPRRTDGRVADGAIDVWGTARFDRLIGEIRG